MSTMKAHMLQLVESSSLKQWKGLFILALLLLSACQNNSPTVSSQLVAAAMPASGFTRAEGPATFSFPEDHGAHPDYQTEWWYYTGNLETEAGRHFGYQLTFFRRALLPASERPPRESAWATDNVYMGHFALTNVGGRDFRFFERFARGSAGLAGVATDPFTVWLEDWRVEEIEPGLYRLQVSQDQLALELTLVDTKGPVLQGDQGYSQKGPEPGNASYYYSLTRLNSSGTVRVNEQSFQVSGESWMDHEYSTGALSQGQIGWDWFSIHLDDGSEVMFFQIRREDGTVDQFSGGSWIAAGGSVTRLARQDFRIEIEDTWRSPRSGATYPSRWTIRVPKLQLTLSLEPFLDDQELSVSYVYWEGAVRVSGSRSGLGLNGQGYVEMTGYAGSMQGQF
jgi:predicted secreted hydrolase